MKRQFLVAFPVLVLILMLLSNTASADTLSGLPDITVVDNAIVSIRYAGTEYVVANGDLVLGTTTRWYIVGGVETLWVDGDPAPPATVPTASPRSATGKTAAACSWIGTSSTSRLISRMSRRLIRRSCVGSGSTKANRRKP